MADIINFSDNSNQENELASNQNELIEVAVEALESVRQAIDKQETKNVPIAQLATLGSGVASLLPVFRTITSNTSFNTEGLYQLANQSMGDVLKVAKNGNNWPSFKTSEGKSKLAQLKEVGSISAETTTVMPIDPATIMMAVALYSIEQQLSNIEEMQKQILCFLESEKESQIEADVEMLGSIIVKYKSAWDDELFTKSNHKAVIDIQRTARKNIISYQRDVKEIIEEKHFFIGQATVNSALDDLLKKFKYYHLSLFSFAMASLIEILLSGNFKEEYIAGIKEEIEQMSYSYRELFTKCSVFLEEMSDSSMESNILKGLGTASKAVGKFIGSIPLIKEGPVDEFLQDSGSTLEETAQATEMETLIHFGQISDPGTWIFTEKMDDLIQIYNHTEQICFDKDNIYLFAS